jgi:hypothetical protein
LRIAIPLAYGACSSICDGAFFHFHSASQPRGHIFPLDSLVVCYSHVTTNLSLPLAANFCIRVGLTRHDTAHPFTYAPRFSFGFSYLHLIDMASGPPSISPMGYAPNDPRRGNALYGRHEEAFARQYVILPNLLTC